jgi:hypothetical protein
VLTGTDCALGAADAITVDRTPEALVTITARCLPETVVTAAVVREAGAPA